MTSNARVLVTGAGGLLGSALLRSLSTAGYSNVSACVRARADLRVRSAVDEIMSTERPEIVFLSAAHVGGVQANKSFPADFMVDNLQIQTNVIDSAYRHGVRKLIFFASNAMYPLSAREPIAEDALLSGKLESSTEIYAVAKIAGTKMCQAYRRQHGFETVTVIPTNIYGPNDNFDPEASHVMPALLRKFYEAERNGRGEVVVWGTGRARREFIYADDLADACVLLLCDYSSEEPVNVGYGTDISIAELAALVRDTLGVPVRIAFDPGRPEGSPSKLLDSSRMRALGWAPKVDLAEGIRCSYRWLTDNWDRLATGKNRANESAG